MDKKIQQDNQTKIQLALAALMFFAPLVQHTLNKWTLELNNKEKTFIQWYIKFGYIALILLAIIILTGSVAYRLESSAIDRIYSWSIILLTIMLIIGTVGIVTDTNILSDDKWLIDIYHQHISIDKKEIFLNYLPVYNIFLRYKEHEFTKPNLIVKESIIAWLVFILVGIFTTPFLTSIVLIVIIIRVTSLLANTDIVHPEVKKFINTLFTKNPEEIRWYIRWSATALIVSLEKGRGTPWGRDLLNTEIQSAKETFSLLYNVELHNSILIKTQYLIAIIIGILLYTEWRINYASWNTLLPLLFIIWRYGIMFIKWNHLPPLPITKEITDLGIYLYEKINMHFKK